MPAPLVDRPLQAGRERGALAPVVGPEHADRHDVGVRRQAVDDPGDTPSRGRRRRSPRRRRPSSSSPSSSTRTLSGARSPIAGWPPSTPESTTATVMPAPPAVAERPVAIEPPERGEALAGRPGGRRRTARSMPAASRRRRRSGRSPPGPAPRPRVAALRPPDEDPEQLPDEVELAGIGGPEAGDLVGEAPQRAVLLAGQHRDGVGDDRVDVAGDVGGAGSLAARRPATIAVSADASRLAASRSSRLARIATAAWRANTAASSMSRRSNAACDRACRGPRARRSSPRRRAAARPRRTAARSRSARRPPGRTGRRSRRPRARAAGRSRRRSRRSPGRARSPARRRPRPGSPAATWKTSRPDAGS